MTKVTVGQLLDLIDNNRESEEICVGDEVMFMNQKYIVVKLMKYVDSAMIINQKDVIATPKKNLKKTGRKYSVVEMLEGLKNDG